MRTQINKNFNPNEKKKKRLAIKTTKYTVKREMLDYILKNKTRNKQNCITHTRKD